MTATTIEFESGRNILRLSNNSEIKPVDDEYIVNIIHESANKGISKAQFELGMMYLSGDRVKEDIVQGKYWLTKAAGQGNSDAQCNLGILYAKKEDM